MPRKRWRARLSYYDNWIINPEDRNAVDDHDLVGHALVDFDELADLPDDIREQLVADLGGAIRFWRAGVKPGKRGLSDEKEAQHIFISDVGRSLERAGLFATRWRKTYEGDGPDIDASESFFFRLARGLADAFGRALPKDLKLAGQRASKIQYGVMSPTIPQTNHGPEHQSVDWGAPVARAGMIAPPTSVEARDRLDRCSCRRRT